MKLFCSYAFSGEDLTEVDIRMRMIVDALQSTGHEAYCDRFSASILKKVDENDVLGTFLEDFEILKQHEGLVAFITSPLKSVGMIMEIGVAISNNIPVYIYEHTSAVGSSYIPKLAKASFVYEDDNELKTLLENFKP